MLPLILAKPNPTKGLDAPYDPKASPGDLSKSVTRVQNSALQPDAPSLKLDCLTWSRTKDGQFRSADVSVELTHQT